MRYFIFIALALSLILAGCTQSQPPEQKACTAEAKLCPDGSAVGRTGPNCEFSPCPGEHICTDAEKSNNACTMEYNPVCGSDGNTYGNGCGACAAKVVSYVQGECNATAPAPLVGNDSDIHGCIGSAGYSWCEQKQKCIRPWEENCTDSGIISAPSNNTGLANPASVYCESHGGNLEIRDTPEGQVGYCIFPNGKECEEWAYFRGTCSK